MLFDGKLVTGMSPLEKCTGLTVTLTFDLKI